MEDIPVLAMDSVSKLIHLGDMDVRLGQLLIDKVCMLIKVSGNVLSGHPSNLAHSNRKRLFGIVCNSDPLALSLRNLGRLSSDLIGHPIMYSASSEG